MIDLRALRIVALSDACEDYQGLYELVWYLNRIHPDVHHAEKVAAASAVVTQLVTEGYISLFASTWPPHEFEPIPLGKQAALAADASSFETPPEPPATFASYASTPKGEAAYKLLPSSAFVGVVW